MEMETTQIKTELISDTDNPFKKRLDPKSDANKTEPKNDNTNEKVEGVEEVEDIEEEKEKHKQEEIEKSHSKHHPVKEKLVNDLVEKIKNSKTLMIVSIKSLPSPQFQEIKKSIREHALVKVAKKNIMLRAINNFNKKSILDLEKHISENCAFVISDIEGYELAGILAQKKTPINAKAGQEAPEDIEIKAGPTDLVPGPAISELGSAGLQVAVEEGKLSIKVSKVIVNKGQEINANVASILQKLNIQPFSVGLNPVAIYDIETEKIYTDIKIDSEEVAEELARGAGKALGFAQKIVYYCKETITYLLGKANAENQSLSKLSPTEQEVKEEPKPVEEKPAEPTDKPTPDTNNVSNDKSKEEVVEAKDEEVKAEQKIEEIVGEPKEKTKAPVGVPPDTLNGTREGKEPITKTKSEEEK